MQEIFIYMTSSSKLKAKSNNREITTFSRKTLLSFLAADVMEGLEVLSELFHDLRFPAKFSTFREKYCIFGIFHGFLEGEIELKIE